MLAHQCARSKTKQEPVPYGKINRSYDWLGQLWLQYKFYINVSPSISYRSSSRLHALNTTSISILTPPTHPPSGPNPRARHDGSSAPRTASVLSSSPSPSLFLIFCKSSFFFDCSRCTGKHSSSQFLDARSSLASLFLFLKQKQYEDLSFNSETGHDRNICTC